MRSLKLPIVEGVSVCIRYDRILVYSLRLPVVEGVSVGMPKEPTSS